MELGRERWSRYWNWRALDCYCGSGATGICRSLRDVRRSTGHALFSRPLSRLESALVDWQGSRALCRARFWPLGAGAQRQRPVHWFYWSGRGRFRRLSPRPLKSAGAWRASTGAWVMPAKRHGPLCAAGFDRLVLDEVVSFHRRQPAVAESHAGDRHAAMIRPMISIIPRLAVDHPSAPHVLYRISREQWLQTLHG